MACDWSSRVGVDSEKISVENNQIRVNHYYEDGYRDTADQCFPRFGGCVLQRFELNAKETIDSERNLDVPSKINVKTRLFVSFRSSCFSRGSYQ